MNYPHFPRLSSIRIMAAAAIAVAFVVTALLFASAPKSSAAGGKPFRNESSQQAPALSLVGAYRQRNLASDLPGIALVEDPVLRHSWGLALNSTSPFWIVNNKTDRASLYKGDVSGSPLGSNAALPEVAIPNIPTVDQAPSLPTGAVANPTGDFPVTVGGVQAPAQFIFVTLNGGINAKNPFVGTAAPVVKYMSGHAYTGVAIGSNASGNFLFVADFLNGKIDVFDKDYNLAAVAGNFTDPSIPANFHPSNIQNLGGALYVTYSAYQFDFSSNVGFVRKFDTNGVRDPAFAINNGPLFDPWGMVIAPANFGAFSNQLLVGNSSSLGIHNASISAFDPATGAFVGNMVDESGAALEIEQLQGLVFGNGVNGGDPNTLYFAAHPAFPTGGAHHGLFGSLKASTVLPVSRIQFSNTEYFTTENSGHFDVTVTRTGDLSGNATVNYATLDHDVTQKSAYEIALGKLTFNPGESTRSFRVLIVDNNLLGGGTIAHLKLVLTNATGAALVSPTTAELSIMDNEFDTPGQPPNILDDPQFFVRQHYFDFLNREPDTSGFNFWVNQITSCGTDQQCIELRKINVSAAFFLSSEFQKTGMLAYLTEKASFGGLPRYGQFMRDVQALQKDYVFGAPGADAQLETNKQAFFDEFVTRPPFAAKYNSLTNSQFVNALFTNGQLNTTTAELYLAKLTGAQVVSPSGSPATGLVVLRRAMDLSSESMSLYLNGLASAETDAHIHGPADPAANGPVIVTLPSGEILNFQIHLGAHNGELAGGRIYVDVHTTNFPNGEIRGQLPSNRFVLDMIINGLDAGIITRAQALRLVAESDFFRTNELNRAFVLMEYFGYLRRNPADPPDNNLNGYNFWLNKLNQFNGNFVSADMVKAFIKSTEYRGRFGPP